MGAVPGSHPINSMRKFPRCSIGWEPAGSLNQLCDFVTWPLAGPIPCSPAPRAASLAEFWPIAQLSRMWLLTLGFLELVKPVYWMCFTASCGLCISQQALPFLWGWAIHSQSLILLCGLTWRSFECSFFIRVLLVLLRILMQQPRPFFLLGIKSSLLALIWCDFI